ncbi:MAG: ATP-binding protein [Bifidobacteriaceae bacterium]|nr:ATP-binding protein [Bifidobacteriaceae bacterium]
MGNLSAQEGQGGEERRNPFTPTFGVTPPELVGRSEELESFRDALAEGPGSPGRAMLFTGARGMGKTVLLNAAEDAAQQAGWLVASVTSRRGMRDELVQTILPALLLQHDPQAHGSTTTGVNVSAAGFGIGATKETTARYEVTPSFRSLLERLAEVQMERGSGVLVSVDEAHRAVVDDLREIAQGVQHAFRTNLDVAFVAAGLPSAVDALLNVDAMTFLRRAERFALGAVRDSEVARALRGPIEAAGRTLSTAALDAALVAIQGYPFFVQLVGYELWAAQPSSREIDGDQAERAVRRAARRAGRVLHEPLLADLSGRDRDFLQAMAQDDGASRLSEIASRLGVTLNHASQYRARLIAADVIEPHQHGQVRFAVPFLRDHLRQHPPTSPDGEVS